MTGSHKSHVQMETQVALAPSGDQSKKVFRFWDLPEELRRRVFEMLFEDHTIAIRTTMDPYHELRKYGRLYHTRPPSILDRLLVSKEFYVEAIKVLPETATFTCDSSIGPPTCTYRPEPAPGISKFSILHARGESQLPPLLRRVGVLQIQRTDMENLVGVARRFDMRLHRVVVRGCRPWLLGLTSERVKEIRNLGKRDCEFLSWDEPYKEPYKDLSKFLVSLGNLRDIEISFGVCRKQSSVRRIVEWEQQHSGVPSELRPKEECPVGVWKQRLVQIELEPGILRKALELAEEKKEQDGGQIRALTMNITRKERSWTLALQEIETE